MEHACADGEHADESHDDPPEVAVEDLCIDGDCKQCRDDGWTKNASHTLGLAGSKETHPHGSTQTVDSAERVAIRRSSVDNDHLKAASHPDDSCESELSSKS